MRSLLAYPRSRLEVILDNLNTHKKNERMARVPSAKPGFRAHIPQHERPGLNQVEGLVLDPAGAVANGVLRSPWVPEQLKQHIDAFIETYNEDTR